MVIPSDRIGDISVIILEVLPGNRGLFVLGPPQLHEFGEDLSLGHAVVKNHRVFGRVVESGQVLQQHLSSTLLLQVRVHLITQLLPWGGQVGDEQALQLGVGVHALALQFLDNST